MCLQFGFVFFWQKDIGAKAVRKMLVKLIVGVLIYDEWQNWNDYPVITTIDKTTRPVSKIPFPAGNDFKN